MNELYHANQLPLFVTDKVCNQCQKEKPLQDFYENPHGKYGRSARCKDCLRANNKDYRQEHYVPVRNKPKAASGNKVCSRCLVEQPISEFHKRTDTNGYRSHCKTCISEAGRSYVDSKGRKIKPMPAAINGGRVCSRCRIEKSLREFTKDSRNKSGYNLCCKECTSAQNRHSYAIPENKQHAIDKHQQWYENNKDAHHKLAKKWREGNPLKTLQYSRKRYASKKGVTVGKVDYQLALDQSDGVCYICEKPILPHHKIEFDHRVPIDKGGCHSQENIEVTHDVCNRRKNSKLLEEMTPLQRRGIL